MTAQKKDEDSLPGKQDSTLLCTFCGKNQNEVKKLIAGPGVNICGQCVDVCNKVLDGSPPSKLPEIAAVVKGKCSFCGKIPEQTASGQMLSGSGASICHECVDLCNEIVNEELFAILEPMADLSKTTCFFQNKNRGKGSCCTEYHCPSTDRHKRKA